MANRTPSFIDRPRGPGELPAPVDHSGQRVVYQEGDRVAILTPAAGVPLETILKRDVPKGAETLVIPARDVPSDKTFRGALAIRNGRLAIDMARARDVWRDRIRRQRAPLLDALDREYVRADEAGDAKAKAKVAARKQKLRDAPADPRIEAAETPEELTAIEALSALSAAFGEEN